MLMDLLRRLRHEDVPPPKPIDRDELRDEMARTDPAFARVRRIQHDALQALTAKGIKDGLALRKERRFWEQHQEKT